MEKQRSQAGFTLIELLIAVSILGILIIGINSIYRTGVTSSNSNEELINLQNEARVVQRRIKNDVRSSSGEFDDIDGGFSIDDDIEYYEEDGSLIRRKDGSENTLTNNLEDFDVEHNEDDNRLNLDGIQLESESGIEYSFSDRVYARKTGAGLGDGGSDDTEFDEEIIVYFRKPEWADDGPNLWINDLGEDYFNDVDNEDMDNSDDWAEYTIETTDAEVEVALQVVFWEDDVAKTLYAGDNYDNWKTYSTDSGEIWIDARDDYVFDDDDNPDNYRLDDEAYTDSQP